MTAAPQIAVFGGSFNPPHVAHVLAVAYLLTRHRLERVIIVPAFRHPFHKELVSFDHRVAMARLAMSDLGGAEVSQIERELGGDVSHTVDTLAALAARHPSSKLRLVIGADVLHDRDKWHRFDRIVELAPPIVLGRAGVCHPEAPVALLPEVSSTKIRAALARGDSSVAPLVPWRVRDYIAEHGLYRTEP
jgi:nicotinate-nucleotide adenylyltransferase